MFRCESAEEINMPVEEPVEVLRDLFLISLPSKQLSSSRGYRLSTFFLSLISQNSTIGPSFGTAGFKSLES